MKQKSKACSPSYEKKKGGLSIGGKEKKKSTHRSTLPSNHPSTARVSQFDKVYAKFASTTSSNLDSDLEAPHT